MKMNWQKRQKEDGRWNEPQIHRSLHLDVVVLGVFKKKSTNKEIKMTYLNFYRIGFSVVGGSFVLLIKVLYCAKFLVVWKFTLI